MSTEHEHHESLSAFLDGELSDQQAGNLIRRLNEDVALRRRHAEYLVIGDVLRGYRHDLPDLTSRVMDALESEPTLMAPMKKSLRTSRRPLLWLAAAATAAITWGLWSAAPLPLEPVPLAAAPAEVQTYLAAHQDYAQAVAAPAESGFTLVSLNEGGAR